MRRLWWFKALKFECIELGMIGMDVRFDCGCQVMIRHKRVTLTMTCEQHQGWYKFKD
jgi:hypothetical protein